MLRIHFTAQDLARTKIASRPDPMWEVLLSLYLLRAVHGGVLFDRWRHETRRRLTPPVRFLSALVPASGSSPDFLTPTGDGSLELGIEKLLSTPRGRLEADVAQMAKERSLPSWTVDLAQGRAEALRGVAGELRRYFTICLAPHWGQVQLHIARDLAHRSQTMAQGGVEALLSTLVPGARWSPPVLELAYPFSHDIHLDGRGLLLQPAFFDHPSPSGQCVTTLVDQELTPVLVYTIDHPLGWMATAEPPNPPPGDPLAALLGSTRARVLCALARGMCTTSELARRAKAPLSTVSRQATILRDAGLIASHRDGNTVLHILTALGVSLCREHPPV